MTAIDSDIGISAIINYKIKSASSFPLKIDATTGEITTSGRLDYETKKKYDITVIANDGKFNTEVPVTINVININDNSPKFVLSKYTGSISESKTPGSVVLTVNATDLDPFGKLLYSSTNGTNVFSIDPQTGEVKTSVNLDRETKDKYVIQVKVSDGGSPQLTATAIVEIKVDDANDNAPLFKNPPSSFNISENKPQDTLVGNVIAEDEDIGVNRQIEYQLKTRMGNFGFRIDPSSGNIFTTKKLDRESITTYILEIIAKDKGNPPLESLTLTVSVNVQDDNDNNPSFLQNPYNGSVSEGANNGSDVIEVKAKDADIGRNGEVIYSILEGNIGNKFEINSITGKLLFI